MDNNIVQQVWENGVVVDGYDASQVRKDSCGAFIVRSQYKNRNSDYGWEIDHVYPVSKGGGDELVNLRPMQWENNVKKGDSFPNYETSIVGEGSSNIRKEGHYTVNENLIARLKSLYKF